MSSGVWTRAPLLVLASCMLIYALWQRRVAARRREFDAAQRRRQRNDTHQTKFFTIVNVTTCVAAASIIAQTAVSLWFGYGDELFVRLRAPFCPISLVIAIHRHHHRHHFLRHLQLLRPFLHRLLRLLPSCFTIVWLHA